MRYPAGHPRHCREYLYRTWYHLVDRCTRSTDRAYPRYGGRGIRVCDRWLASFDSFCDDVGERPTPKHTIDRIDNDGDYEPENVQWATRTEQSRNRRNTVRLAGVSLAEAAETAGIPYRRAYTRVYRGLSEQALSTESLRTKSICRRGHSRSGTNLYVSPDGRRMCKSCLKINRQQSGK
jgi:DNA-directed RNA polymerase specialized sigma24 family protein